MVYVDPQGLWWAMACTAYMRLRRMPCWAFGVAVGSIVGVDGGVDAIQAALYRPMRPDQLPEFRAAAGGGRAGCRVVYAPEAVLAGEKRSE